MDPTKRKELSEIVLADQGVLAKIISIQHHDLFMAGIDQEGKVKCSDCIGITEKELKEVRDHNDDLITNFRCWDYLAKIKLGKMFQSYTKQHGMFPFVDAKAIILINGPEDYILNYSVDKKTLKKKFDEIDSIIMATHTAFDYAILNRLCGRYSNGALASMTYTDPSTLRINYIHQAYPVVDINLLGLICFARSITLLDHASAFQDDPIIKIMAKLYDHSFGNINLNSRKVKFMQEFSKLGPIPLELTSELEADIKKQTAMDKEAYKH
ncbi:MAG: hypothetical protein NT001_00840 [Candidatus Woesearchaeota archaeon]|nr:hypothetical protein [Candidatus Woesearchaeota archaeon]